MRKHSLTGFYLFSLSVASFTGHERKYLSRRALLAAAAKRRKLEKGAALAAASAKPAT